MKSKKTSSSSRNRPAPKAKPQKRALKTHRNGESEYELLVNLSLDILCIASDDGYFKWVNPAFETILGYSHSELLTKPFLDFVHPDDVESTIAEVKRQSAGGSVLSFENRYRCKDGSYKWLAWKSQPGPKPGSMYATARDVTAQKETEENIRRQNEILEQRVVERTKELAEMVRQLEKAHAELEKRVEERTHALRASEMRYTTLFHSTDEGFCIIEMIFDERGKPVDYRFLEINPAFERQTGLRDAVGKRMRELAPEHEEHWFEIYGRVAMGGEPVRFQNHAEQLNRYYDVYACRIGEPKDRLVAILFNDITEKRQMESALREAKEWAENANHSKSEFLSRMSHELRTPMNAILGFGQLLEFSKIDDKQKESLSYIMKAGRHLLRLINEVLEISRIEIGSIGLSLEPVDVGEILNETVSLMQTQAAESGIRLQLHAEEMIYALADAQRLRQVSINLISNAIKYNRDGGFARIEARKDSSKGVIIEVSDSGMGLSEENVAKLFTPFERLGAESTGIEGTGLGLALSKRLVEAMGGSILVRSKEGEGTCFSVRLAVATPKQESEVPVQLPSSRPLKEGATYKVLLIEDNMVNAELVKRVFSTRPDIELKHASFGQHGIELAKAIEPDCILLDLHLPDIGGKEVLAEIKSLPNLNKIPIIIVSADAFRSQSEKLLRAGAFAYITKPFDLRDLIHVVDEALNPQSKAA